MKKKKSDINYCKKCYLERKNLGVILFHAIKLLQRKTLKEFNDIRKDGFNTIKIEWLIDNLNYNDNKNAKIFKSLLYTKYLETCNKNEI